MRFIGNRLPPITWSGSGRFVFKIGQKNIALSNEAFLDLQQQTARFHYIWGGIDVNLEDLVFDIIYEDGINNFSLIKLLENSFI